MQLKSRWQLLFFPLFMLVQCQPSGEGEFAVPVLHDDGWEVSTPRQQGMNEELLAKLLARLPRENPGLDAFMVARHGKLVAEAYFNGYSVDQLHKIWSITKAVTGTLLGIAVDQQQLLAEDTIRSYLSAYLSDTSTTVNGITVEHLITMRSGWQWEELGGPGSTGFQLPYTTDWIRFILERPRVRKPGEVFNYSTGNTLLLAPILKEATGWPVKEYAREKLFSPMKITHYEWDTHGEFWSKTQGGELPGAKLPEPFPEIASATITNTGSGLRMRPRDMLKLGQLYLDKGKWNDEQLVSEQWINASVRPHFGNPSYGYHWRIMSFGGHSCYYATGFGLQCLFVFPGLDLVVGLNQQYYRDMESGSEKMEALLRYLLEAVPEKG